MSFGEIGYLLSVFVFELETTIDVRPKRPKELWINIWGKLKLSSPQEPLGS